jgi:hypothetical protein
VAGHLQARSLREVLLVREHVLLQRDRHPALLCVHPGVVQTQRRTGRDLLGDLHVLLGQRLAVRGPGEMHQAERLSARHQRRDDHGVEPRLAQPLRAALHVLLPGQLGLRLLVEVLAAPVPPRGQAAVRTGTRPVDVLRTGAGEQRLPGRSFQHAAAREAHGGDLLADAGETGAVEEVLTDLHRHGVDEGRHGELRQLPRGLVHVEGRTEPGRCLVDEREPVPEGPRLQHGRLAVGDLHGHPADAQHPSVAVLQLEERRGERPVPVVAPSPAAAGDHHVGQGLAGLQHVAQMLLELAAVRDADQLRDPASHVGLGRDPVELREGLVHEHVPQLAVEHPQPQR